MTTLSIFFTPQALARPSTRKVSPTRSSRNSKLKTKPLPSKSRPPPPPLSTAPLSGGDATTYTCLPTRDDFPFGHGPNGSSVVLKLSEVAVPSSLKNKSPLGNVEYQEAISGSNDGGFDGNLEMNCASIDMIEGDSRSDDEEINGGGEVLNLEDRSSVNFSSSSVLNAGEESGSKEDEIENGFAGSDFFEEEEVKEKGVPAIMRCFDRAKIYVKSGDGGNGVVAFRREKHVQFGGPSGGDGGRGGNVYVEVDGAMNSLLPFRNNIHFRAGRGSNGQGSKQAGARGEDVIVKVPPGTVIREDGENGVQPSVVLELVNPGQRALLLPGGRGGKGNASFRSGTNKAPRIAEDGEEGPEMWMELELKLVADVGIVGAPNAGKSTLLSVISAAQPTVANYPFTTLLPNLGVVSFDYSSTMVVADLPGLLEGAHRGFGLGHEFLRHTERCSVLVHVVDGSGPQPEYEFDAIRLELELFNPKLAEKPFVVAYNKMDLPEAHEKWPTFKEKLEAQGIGPFCMSAVKKEGTHAVICAAYALLQKRKTFQVSEEWNPVNLNHVADKIRKEQTASIREFEISHDSGTNTWHVVGSGLQRFVQMTNWRYIDSEKRFQHVLEACGVNRSLLKRGVKEGDTVIVGGMELVWHDYPNNNSASDIKKSESSIRQPQ